MKVLVTGTAGFIGFSLAKRLLERGDDVVGIDNHNDYYDVSLKEARVKCLIPYSNYRHLRMDIADDKAIERVFIDHRFDCVVHLAAQAGVRYSIDHPSFYIQSNIVGFANILESSRKTNISHLIYASSSSVYGANIKQPFSIHDNVDHPLNLYAASKKSNELMAHAYSHLFKIPTTGLRFFTVYGPWGRPDMALFKFATSIKKGEAIEVYNNGHHSRDFTYIDDVVEAIVRILNRPARPNDNWDGLTLDPASSLAPWRIYNIGNNKPTPLLDYISALEMALGCKAKLTFLPQQAGDMISTVADICESFDDFDYAPKVSISEGIQRFVSWFNEYYDF